MLTCCNKGDNSKFLKHLLRIYNNDYNIYISFIIFTTGAYHDIFMKNT